MSKASSVSPPVTGDEKTREVDVRVVAATNRNLKREVEKGRFRQDLYYRLNVFPIEVPPLKDRKEDVALLAAHFAKRAARELRRPVPRLTEASVRQLRSYDWPGNVRELQNVIERAVITSRAGALRFDLVLEEAQDLAPAGPSPKHFAAPVDEVIPESEMLRRERENLLAALQKAGWRIYGPRGAAELLGVKPSTLASRIKKMGLTKPD